MDFYDTVQTNFKGNINNYRDFEMIYFHIFIGLIFGAIGGDLVVLFLDMGRFIKLWCWYFIF